MTAVKMMLLWVVFVLLAVVASMARAAALQRWQRQGAPDYGRDVVARFLGFVVILAAVLLGLAIAGAP